MIQDLYAVFRNEWRGFFRYGQSKRSGWIRWSALAILGVIGTRALGPEFGATWMTVVAAAFIAIIFIPAVVADSFAGERERHTLETLLASRISDTALLLGKYMANVLYGWIASLGMLLFGILIAYLGYGGTANFQVQPSILAAAASISLLCAGTITGVGILVSLRAPTVRRATESLTIVLIATTTLPALITALPIPEWLSLRLPQLPEGDPGIRAFFVVIALLLALNATLLGIALARFQRARLIV
jgi:ABC-2 type transport system permease protein